MKKTGLKKYIITSSFALIVIISLLYAFGLFSGELSVDEVIRAFSDAFSATGILFAALFCLVFVSSQGMFDSLSYIGTVAVRAFVPGMRLNKYEKYGDYKLRKAEKRLNVKDYLFILYVGLASLAVGIVFTVVFFFV